MKHHSTYSKVLFLLGIIVTIFGVIPHHTAASAHTYSDAIIYFNRACSGCSKYLDEELKSILEEKSFEVIEYRDYINHKEFRSELNELSEGMGIPFDLQSHIMVFIGDDLLNGNEINSPNIKTILAGHIPESITRYLIQKENLKDAEKVIVFQDKMPNMEEVNSYKAWAFAGDVKEYDIDEPILTYLSWLRENDILNVEASSNASWNWKKTLPTVLVTGFLDGLNPCAFAVLLFFISYLFTIKKARIGILKMGIVYIVAIYLAYLLIGIGLFKAILITGIPHFMAWVGSILIIILGLSNVISHFYPKFPIKLKLPDFSKGIVQEYMYKATIPAAFILGFVVGLCTFPCSGGPYVAVILMLSSQVTFLKGLAYLLIYNLMFVTPLIIVLALSGSKYATENILDWESSKSSKMRLISGFLMVALGLIIILFFI